MFCLYSPLPHPPPPPTNKHWLWVTYLFYLRIYLTFAIVVPIRIAPPPHSLKVLWTFVALATTETPHKTLVYDIVQIHHFKNVKRKGSATKSELTGVWWMCYYSCVCNEVLINCMFLQCYILTFCRLWMMRRDVCCYLSHRKLAFCCDLILIECCPRNTWPSHIPHSS